MGWLIYGVAYLWGGLFMGWLIYGVVLILGWSCIQGSLTVEFHCTCIRFNKYPYTGCVH